MNARRDALLIGSYPPPFGGVPRHIEEFAPILVERGWAVHVLASGHSGVERHGGVTVYKERRARKAVRACGGLVRGDLRRVDAVRMDAGLGRRVQLLSWLGLGRSIARRNPVKIICVYNLLRLPVGMLLSEELGIPMIVANFGEIYSDFVQLQAHRAVIERGVRSAARLICMSRHCAASYSRLGITHPVDVLPYGVDVSRFSPDVPAATMRERCGVGNADPLVVFVGRLVADMGLDTFLDAVPSVLAANPHSRVLIAGGRGGLAPAAEALAAAHPGKITVMTDVPAQLLPQMYAAADLVVAPTPGDRACGSLASLEAMASGKPVVAARVGGVPEIVVHEQTGLLVAPRDSTALAAALESLLRDPRGRAELGAAGRVRAVSEFDARVLNLRIEALFSEISGTAGRA